MPDSDGYALLAGAIEEFRAERAELIRHSAPGAADEITARAASVLLALAAEARSKRASEPEWHSPPLRIRLPRAGETQAL